MIYRVTRLMLINGRWIDGPVEFMNDEELDKFMLEHTHYKVELVQNFSSIISTSTLRGFEYYTEKEPSWWKEIDK